MMNDTELINQFNPINLQWGLSGKLIVESKFSIPLIRILILILKSNYQGQYNLIESRSRKIFKINVND